jgi:hypothetical protein
VYADEALVTSFPFEPPVTPLPRGADERQPPAEVRPFPAPETEPEPELPPAAQTRVLVRLRSGEVLEAGEFSEPDEARARARALVEELRTDDVWPFVAGSPLDAADVDAIYLLAG